MARFIKKAKVNGSDAKAVPRALKTEEGTPIKASGVSAVKGIASTPSVPRGMRDILPQDQPAWDAVQKTLEQEFRSRGYERIDTPILEEASLFLRSIGRATDIIEKEIFVFEDPGGSRIALRPEATASVARAYIKHGMLSWPQPVKLWYWGAMFRHDRPQAGRYRQFIQAGVEVLGDRHPVVDAQVVMAGVAVLRKLSIPVTVAMNSTGCSICRSGYLTNLTDYYRSKRGSLCQDCKRRMAKNPLRMLDCKEPFCQPLKHEAPQIIDHLCLECKDHFVRVLEYCDELEIPYQLDSTLVRGLDYYSKTVFELIPASSEEPNNARQDALGGGGRYDGLVTALGGRETPACGFSFGIDRIVNHLKDSGAFIPSVQKPLVFFAQLGEQARRRALGMVEQLRREGIPVVEQFSKDSLKSQLEVANRLGVATTVILGQKEVLDGTVLLRDMDGGVQEVIDSQRIVEELKKKCSL